ncbi:hypothetical protein CL660_000050 [bacterium]|nr:hypothetical protein [bacterium]
MKIPKIIILFIFLISGNIFASEKKSLDNHKNHVNNAHHKNNHIMLSYKYMYMKMDGYLKGSSDASYSDARTKPNGSNYMTVPLEMSMNMHMLSGMYTLSNDITIMLMGSYFDKEMEMKKHSSGKKKKMKSNGWGDTKFNFLKKIYNKNKSKININLGISLPTGSIEKKDTMFSGSKETLGYGMQLGSGTYDLLYGLTYNKFQDNYSYGVSISSVKRIGENSKDYSLGDIYQSNLFIAKPINNETFINLESEFKFQEKIDGSHKDILSVMSFAQDKESSGYKRIDLSFGVTHKFKNFNNLKMALKFKKPIYNDVNAVQLETENLIIIGLQYSY